MVLHILFLYIVNTIGNWNLGPLTGLCSHILCNSLSGIIPRGDTGGGQSSACKHEGHPRPASLRLNICRDLQLLAWSREGSRVIWSSCFVQTLSLCSCLTIKDLSSNIIWPVFCVARVSFSVMCMFGRFQGVSVLGVRSFFPLKEIQTACGKEWGWNSTARDGPKSFWSLHIPEYLDLGAESSLSRIISVLTVKSESHFNTDKTQEFNVFYVTHFNSATFDIWTVEVNSIGCLGKKVHCCVFCLWIFVGPINITGTQN